MARIHAATLGGHHRYCRYVRRLGADRTLARGARGACDDAAGTCRTGNQPRGFHAGLGLSAMGNARLQVLDGQPPRPETDTVRYDGLFRSGLRADPFLPSAQGCFRGAEEFRPDVFGARQGLPAGRYAGIRRAGRFGGEYLDVLPVKTHCPERYVQGLQRKTAGAFLYRGHVREVGMYFLGAVFCRIHADSALLFSGGIYRRIVGGRRSVDTGDRSEIQTG